MLKKIGIALLLSFVAACDSDNDSDLPNNPPAPEPPATALVEVVHASPDAPNVNVLIDGEVQFSDVPYKAGAGLEAEVGTISLSVEGIIPGGNATVIGPANIEVMEDERTTVLAINAVGSIEPLILVEAVADLGTGQTRARVVHAAPGAPMVDVYVTEPGVDLNGEAPLGTFEFRGVLGPVTVDSATYQVRVAAAGDPSAVVFDAGEIELADGADLVIVAVENTGAGDAPISLLAISEGSVTELIDVNSPSDLRVVHASPDAPAVDVVANDNFDEPVVVNLEFPEFTDYLSVAAGDLSVGVVPTGNEAPVVIDADVALTAGETYSVYAVDVLNQIEPLVLVDDRRSIATEARVRILHASPTAGNVDIYVVEPGVDIATTTANFSDVPFKAETGYVSLAPGDYDVVVTGAGSTDAAIGPVTISVEPGGIYTAAARDEIGGGMPLGLILLDDFGS